MAERYISEFDHLIVGAEHQPWIDAFLALDEGGDKKPLIKLLRKNAPVPWPAPWHLADLLERYKLTKRQNRGGVTSPSYDYPPALRELIRAKKYYERKLARGTDKNTAFKEAAAQGEVNQQTLRNFVAGKNAHARRVEKRKPPPNPRP